MAGRAEPCVERWEGRKETCQIYIGTEFKGENGSPGTSRNRSPLDFVFYPISGILLFLELSYSRKCKS